MKNWWHYHKWYVVCGAVLFLILVDLAGNALGWFQETPDVQIAYIGENGLPEETAAALENAFATFAGDYNGDGKVRIQINQYILPNPNTSDAESLSYRQASLITLMGDIQSCESYFFLMENPDDIQREFQVLAMPDGSCPGDTDFSTEGKVFQWKFCRLLSELALGNYSVAPLGQTESGSNQELLADLYLGRRCFYSEKRTDYADECGELWKTLQGGCK